MAQTGAVVVSKNGELIAGAPPDPEQGAGRWVYRDALVARLLGFRPLMLDLVTPVDCDAAPVVVFIYGGAFATGSHKRSPLGDYLADRLASRGIAVAYIQHRHSREAPFPAQLHDVKAAVRWLRHYAADLGLDASRFAAWGVSSGGHLATMLAVTGQPTELEGDVGVTGPSSSVQAAVSWSAPANLRSLPPAPPGSPFHGTADDPHAWLVGAPLDTVPDRVAAASTLTYVSNTSAPLLLAHGTQDDGIPIDQSEQLATAYQRAGATVELIRVPGAGHFFDEPTRAHLVDAGLDFLGKHLGLA